MKRIFFVLSIIATVLVVVLVVGEVMVRVSSPVRTMYPRYKFIPEYGFGLYPNRRVVHACPGKFKFHYTVNEYGHRGRALSPADSNASRNIVVLGDSFAFGQGVSDGEPFAAVLDDLLGDDYAVLNLGSPGWGLTQQIRRYYEFARKYKPETVLLQYCWNDPEDNLNHSVTVVEDGEFRFQTSKNTTNWVKKYVSGSLIQKSQLYNFYRGRVYEWFQNRLVRKRMVELQQKGEPAAGGASAHERYYVELFELFAAKLHADGVRLIVISVENQLHNFPYIAESILELHESDRLQYVDLDLLFKDAGRGDNFYSLEGHWGPRAHRLIAQELATVIRARR